MAIEMTKDWLLRRCKAQGLYRTPSLNDSLYLQCQAFSEIQNLDEYTGVKQLHLEENCIESLNGVQPLKQLQCLYLHRNFVRALDHLEELEDLDTLDLSQNCLSKLDNLSKCSKLRILVVSHNLLDSVASIEHLSLCPSIMILDLSHNKLKDGDGVLGVAKSLANLTVLYLSGNPFVAVFPHYRKKLIGILGKLNYLDDRPIFWDERRYAEAWMRGGQEEESGERDIVREMRATEETLQFEAMRQLRYQAMEERQYVPHRPMLQFSPEELGENVESLGSPPPDNMDQASVRKIEVQDGETGPFEDTELRTLPFAAKVGENWTAGGYQGHDLVGCSTSYSEMEAACSLEHALMLAQDQSQQWEPDYFIQHGSKLSNDKNQQCHTERLKEEEGSTIYSHGGEGRKGSSQSNEGKHIEFSSTASSNSQPNSMQQERMVQTQNQTWPAACPSMLQDLGKICLPAWESRSQVMSELPVKNITKINNDHHEVKPSVDSCQSCEPTDEQGAPSPPPQEMGNDSFEWTRYYANPSFCGGPQFDDNFLLSVQGMTHTEPNCNKGKLNNNPSFCGQQIDDNFVSMY